MVIQAAIKIDPHSLPFASHIIPRLVFCLRRTCGVLLT
jgi:hypothetical protein